jgi:hypothetical protein
MVEKYVNVSIEGEDGSIAAKETVTEAELGFTILRMMGNALAVFTIEPEVDATGEPL